MMVEFHNGPLEGESKEMPEPLHPRVQSAVCRPIIYTEHPTLSVDFETVVYELVRDADGPYYVYRDA